MKSRSEMPRIGETWITRSGMSVAIVNSFDDSVRGVDSRKVVHRFYHDGSYIGPSFPHNMDLMDRI